MYQASLRASLQQKDLWLNPCSTPSTIGQGISASMLLAAVLWQRGGHSQSYQPVRNGHVHRPGRTNLLVMNRTSLWSAAVMHIHLSRAFQGRRQACICQSCHAFSDEASSPLTESELCQMWPKCQRSKKSLIPLHSYTRVLALLHCKE